jgi:hypothetical protein
MALAYFARRLPEQGGRHRPERTRLGAASKSKAVPVLFGAVRGCGVSIMAHSFACSERGTRPRRRVRSREASNKWSSLSWRDLIRRGGFCCFLRSADLKATYAISTGAPLFALWSRANDRRRTIMRSLPEPRSSWAVGGRGSAQDLARPGSE